MQQEREETGRRTTKQDTRPRTDSLGRRWCIARSDFNHPSVTFPDRFYLLFILIFRVGRLDVAGTVQVRDRISSTL